MPKFGGSTQGRENRQKGMLGMLLAVPWYKARYPGALITSLDSDQARLWLQVRPGGNKRADLIAVRLTEGTNTAVIEPIEVKTQASITEARITRDSSTGQRQITGRVSEQLQTMLTILEPIFGDADAQTAQPLFIPCREALKYQFYRECFRQTHDPDWRQIWYERLSEIFALPSPKMIATCVGEILHIQLEENMDEEII